MRSLPFVVKPKRHFSNVKIGNESTGIIEIERRGYLTVSEKAFVDGVTQGSDGIASIVSLATRIGSKTKHTTEDAFTGVMKAVQGDLEDPFAVKIREEYPDEIGSILAEMTNAMQQRSVAAATILIRSRIDSEWSVDDTLNQDPELIAAFAEFYAQEESGLLPSSEELNNTKETGEGSSVAEIVGKSTEENGEE